MRYRLKFLLLPKAKDARWRNGGDLDEEIFPELKSKWPQFFLPGRVGFNFEADEDDPVYEEVVAYFREYGREPYAVATPSWSNNPPVRMTHYKVEGMRIFEASDIEKAEFFTCNCPYDIARDSKRSADGVLRIAKGDAKGGQIGMVMDSALFICTDALKREMEETGFVGAVFHRVETPSRSGAGASFWEIGSDRQMPPVLNALVNYMGEPFDASRHRDCWVDDFYSPPVLRFRAAEVREMGPFDTALTRDGFGNPREPKTVFSRRFREWCVARKLKNLEWIPVALE